jgi:hypothetical protein
MCPEMSKINKNTKIKPVVRGNLWGKEKVVL